MKVKILPDERLDYLLKDQRQIIQTKDSFAYSLDTILLADFAQQFVHDNHRVADLCAGNGAASLFMSYGNRAKYDLVEIQTEMADKARRSIQLNDLDYRMQVYEGDVKESFSFWTKDNYDIVICNPPYFKVPTGHTINPEEKKAIARHEIMINLEQVIQIASGLLKTRGKFFMVHRPERLAEIIKFCDQNDLGIKFIQPYLPKEGKDANLIVVGATRNTNSDGLNLKAPIVVHDEANQYTSEIKAILNGRN